MQIQAMHFFHHFQYHKRENSQLIIFCANIQKNSLVRHACKHSFQEIHEVNLRTLTEKHVITFRNLLYQHAWAILVKRSEINMTPLITLNKIQRFIT